MTKRSENRSSFGVFSVAAMGIGSMVGAGIFALLGQVSQTLHAATWIAFVLGGIVALFCGYAYAKLGATYPSSGGIMDFFVRGLPGRKLSIGLSTLFLITLAITIAMVANAFGAYATRLFHESTQNHWLVSAYTAGIILALFFLNVLLSRSVGRAELALVVIKLSILVILMVAGFFSIDEKKLEIIHFPDANSLLSATGLGFFAYAGFGMMANASDKVSNPQKVMPRAFFLAISIVIILYVGLAFVLVGNIPANELVKHADTAVAQVAYPIFGRLGYVVVSIAALIATASAINATIFSAINIMQSMSSKHMLPAIFSSKLFRQITTGNLISILAVVILAVSLKLASLANIASATFLICYLAVFITAWRFRKEIHAAAVPLQTGFVLMLILFVGFIYSIGKQGTLELIIIALSLLFSAVIACVIDRK